MQPEIDIDIHSSAIYKQSRRCRNACKDLAVTYEAINLGLFSGLNTDG